MSTIQYKCDYCKQVRIGMKEQVCVKPHYIFVNKGGVQNLKFIDKYYICENCVDYDRKKYMEV